MIRVRDIHEQGGAREEATSIFFGTYTCEGDVRAVTYEELAGAFAGSTVQITCTGGNEVSVLRDGPHPTELVIERGRRHVCQYDTDYGSILMGVFGESVDCDMTGTGGTLSFTYTIDTDGSFVTRNTLQITVKETF